MNISTIGEFGLIKRISRRIKTDDSVIKGSGDDCAVIKFNRYYYQLLTCDMIVEGVDFEPDTKPYLIGRKAVGVCLSDIAACAGLPRYALVALGIPADTSLKKVDEICRGMLKLAREYKVNIVGGDVSRSKILTLDVSMVGMVEKKSLVLRSTAKAGDIIFVTGSLGDSIKDRHLTFRPRIKEARFLVKNFKVNAMIDISDGLVQDLGHVLEESKVGAIIYESLIPRYQKSTSLNSALYGGEDFELLFTLPLIQAKKLIAKKYKAFHPIGQIVEKRFGSKLIGKDCRQRPLQPQGFTHF